MSSTIAATFQVNGAQLTAIVKRLEVMVSRIDALTPQPQAYHRPPPISCSLSPPHIGYSSPGSDKQPPPMLPHFPNTIPAPTSHPSPASHQIPTMHSILHLTCLPPAELHPNYSTNPQPPHTQTNPKPITTQPSLTLFTASLNSSTKLVNHTSLPNPKRQSPSTIPYNTNPFFPTPSRNDTEPIAPPSTNSTGTFATNITPHASRSTPPDPGGPQNRPFLIHNPNIGLDYPLTMLNIQAPTSTKPPPKRNTPVLQEEVPKVTAGPLLP